MFSSLAEALNFALFLQCDAIALYKGQNPIGGGSNWALLRRSVRMGSKRWDATTHAELSITYIIF